MFVYTFFQARDLHFFACIMLWRRVMYTLRQSASAREFLQANRLNFFLLLNLSSLELFHLFLFEPSLIPSPWTLPHPFNLFPFEPSLIPSPLEPSLIPSPLEPPRPFPYPLNLLSSSHLEPTLIRSPLNPPTTLPLWTLPPSPPFIHRTGRGKRSWWKFGWRISQAQSLTGGKRFDAGGISEEESAGIPATRIAKHLVEV